MISIFYHMTRGIGRLFSFFDDGFDNIYVFLRQVECFIKLLIGVDVVKLTCWRGWDKSEIVIVKSNC